MPHPSLVCIGAQRAGTTWLHNALQTSGKFWLPGDKEYNYLYFSPASRERSRQARPEECDERSCAWWDIYLSPWSLDNYRELFSLHTPYERSADISPNYALMTAAEITAASSYIEGARILFIARNPVDRAWSAVKKFVDLGRTNDEAEQAIFDTYIRAYSDYAQTVTRWTESLPNCSFKIAFYDDIRERPLELLRALGWWLGTELTISATATESRINPSNETKMATSIAETARSYFAPFISEFRFTCERHRLLLPRELPSWLCDVY